jgi:adenylyltransferase/sulfurtransferase
MDPRTSTMMREISAQELKKMRDGREPLQLIDVREPYEVERCSIGGENIPLGDIVSQLGRIRKDIPVVMHCNSGSRSAAVVNALETRYGFSNLMHLTGGIKAVRPGGGPVVEVRLKRSP